jgi:hypothetical protein
MPATKCLPKFQDFATELCRARRDKRDKASSGGKGKRSPSPKIYGKPKQPRCFQKRLSAISASSPFSVWSSSAQVPEKETF